MKAYPCPGRRSRTVKGRCTSCPPGAFACLNLKKFNDVERLRNNLKAAWSIEQTAKGLGIGEATVRRIMAEYNKNENMFPKIG